MQFDIDRVNNMLTVLGLPSAQEAKPRNVCCSAVAYGLTLLETRLGLPGTDTYHHARYQPGGVFRQQVKMTVGNRIADAQVALLERMAAA